MNCVAPGSIQFPGGSWDKRVKADPEGMRAFVKANLPLGRFGRGEEVGDVVAFLASERAEPDHGSVYCGGWGAGEVAGVSCTSHAPQTVIRFPSRVCSSWKTRARPSFSPPACRR